MPSTLVLRINFSGKSPLLRQYKPLGEYTPTTILIQKKAVNVHFLATNEYICKNYYMQKSIFKSKIFWSALIPMAIDIVNLLMETPMFPQEYRGYLTIVSSILIIIFRYFSNTPIQKI